MGTIYCIAGAVPLQGVRNLAATLDKCQKKKPQRFLCAHLHGGQRRLQTVADHYKCNFLIAIKLCAFGRLACQLQTVRLSYKVNQISSVHCMLEQPGQEVLREGSPAIQSLIVSCVSPHLQRMHLPAQRSSGAVPSWTRWDSQTRV